MEKIEAVYHVQQHSSWRRSTSAAGKIFCRQCFTRDGPRQVLEMDNHVFAQSVLFQMQYSALLTINLFRNMPSG